MPVKTIIMGAAGRDFHNFNTFFRGNKDYEVVAFTATQIPDIEGRVFPKELAGDLYPQGIPILAEEELSDLIKKHGVQQVIFAYSDVPHEYVMHQAALVNAAGADFRLMGTRYTQIKSSKPVVSICAVRTGSGKSQTTRRVSLILRELGYKVAAIRHPMPYGNLIRQEVQRFADYDDLDEHECTIEEREEYEPHLDNGVLVFAGVDYEKIVRLAEKEVDIVLWDGGNNDLPFYVSDYQIVVADPHRPGHELKYYPGETNVRLADVFVINKVDTAIPRRGHRGPREPSKPQSQGDPDRSRFSPLRGRSRRDSRQARPRHRGRTRPSPTARWPTARAMSPRGDSAQPRSSTRGPLRSNRSLPPTKSTRRPDPFCPPWATVRLR